MDVNVINLTWSYYDGGVDFNGTIPITGATGTYSIPIFSYYHSFSFFGRSANITGFLPYGVGTFQGSFQGKYQQIYRSGLLDIGLRFSVNLKGGPAMRAAEFGKWKQKLLLGASLFVVPPTGQYDPKHLVNWGINRWAVKPEFGYSQPGVIGSSMATLGHGSTQPTMLRLHFLNLDLKPRNLSGPLKGI
jgi:hypothetical protein